MMALSITSCATVTSIKQQGGLSRSCSSKDLYASSRLPRSYSDNHLCYSINRVRASTTEPKLKNSPSVGVFSFRFSGSLITNPLVSSLLDPLTQKEINAEENMVERDQGGNEIKVADEQKRANWVERIIELRSQWRQKQLKNDEHSRDEDNKDSDENGAEDGCEVEYDDEGSNIEIDAKSFSKLLSGVSWSDTKLFSKLAFLCNMAYVIPEIKAKDIRRYYGLDLVTSSLVKKAEAVAMKIKLDEDSSGASPATSATIESGAENKENSGQNRLPHPSVAYQIAASAASYVQSRAKGILSIGSKPQLEISNRVLHAKGKHQQGEENEAEEGTPSRMNKSEMAAYVTTSTMTTVVAADEEQKQKAARDLQSLHSSPCEWFVCDDSSIYTRCFIIQGSDSLASWQANLFFEPTIFEGTDVLVHRGIYEAAKGIYEQFMPEITQHLERFGDRAKIQFTGHSLGGSLSLLVNLMLLTRKVVKPSTLLPVVTFGSPFVFCGGQNVLDKLGLDENQVHCVMMHRDIVPRAFSCNYPKHVVQVLKRLNGTFRSHPCLNKSKLLYSPMGKIFILQPDEDSSPAHPFLPPGSALYALKSTNCATTASAIRAFLNTPHPLETLSDPTAYGSEGTILRDHDSSNYLKAVNKVIRQHTRKDSRKARQQGNLLWPLLTSQSPHAWSHDQSLEDMLATKEIMTGA